MADFTQPSTWSRQADTNHNLTNDEESFTATFAANGYITFATDGTRTYHDSNGSTADVSVIGKQPIFMSPDATGPLTYTGYIIRAMRVVSTDHFFCEVQIDVYRPTTSVLFKSPQTIIELDWVAADESLTGHARYATELSTATATHTAPDGTVTTLVKMADILEGWDKAGSDTALRKSFFAAMSGSSLTQELAGKYQNGVRTYSTYHPVVRRTNREASSPVYNGAGFISSPPISVPGSWQFLKTAARSTHSGESQTWETIEEWTGAAHIDTDIYS